MVDLVVHLSCDTMVVCSKLAENEIDFFIYAKCNCELNVKGWRNLRDIWAAKRMGKTTHNEL